MATNPTITVPSSLPSDGENKPVWEAYATTNDVWIAASPGKSKPSKVTKADLMGICKKWHAAELAKQPVVPAGMQALRDAFVQGGIKDSVQQSLLDESQAESLEDFAAIDEKGIDKMIADLKKSG